MVPGGDKVTSVKLRVYVTQNATNNGGLEVHPEKDNWQANTVTWNNQPDWQSNVLAISSTPKAGTWETINLPVSALNADGNSDFGIRYSVGANVVTEFHSKESGQYAPQLIVTFAPKSTTSAMNTSGKVMITAGSLGTVLAILIML